MAKFCGWVIGLALSVCGFAVAGTWDGQAAPERTNVLIILADDLGYSDLGSYGGEIETPVLERLARDGLQFAQFYNTARCWPTRAALLTGYYPQQVRRDRVEGLPSGNNGQRPKWARLLPERLKEAGYRSYHSGKWHVDGSPLAGGFDRAYTLNDHDRFFGPRDHREDGRPLPTPSAGEHYYATTAIAEHAIRCLQDHAQAHSEKPFFSYVAFTAPHFPLQAEAEDIDRCRERYRAGWDQLREDRWRKLLRLGLVPGRLSPIDREQGPTYPQADLLAKLGPGEVDRGRAWSELPGEVQRFQVEKMAIHAAMIERMDKEIGRIVAQLRTMGEYERTLIMFLSDNGASAELMVRGEGHDPAQRLGGPETFLCLGPGWSSLANTPFRKHKTWVHEGGIATPLVVHWPRGPVQVGQLRASPGHVIDVMPTVLEVAGLNPPGAQDEQAPVLPGRSLLPLFRGEVENFHPWLWWQHEGNRAYREGDWKIVAAGENQPWELYDLSRDRTELENLAAVQPERVKQLSRAWAERLTIFEADAGRDLAPTAGK